MDATELHERLKKLDTNKLIDVVKNYRQYGYNEDVRNYALSLLEEQGISKTDLQLTGNLENTSFNYASDLLETFRSNSKLAFLLYVLLIIVKLIAIWFSPQSGFGNKMLLIAFILCAVLYLIFLIRSFLNQSEFYKTTGEDFGTDGALVYILLGMPFYFFMYFVFQKQMNERLQMVH